MMKKNSAVTEEELNEILAGVVVELEAEEAEISAAWSKFDDALKQRALTLPELRKKLTLAQWALRERDCPEQAAQMISSCVDDLDRNE